MKRNLVITIRVNEPEKAMIERGAERAQKPIAEYLRWLAQRNEDAHNFLLGGAARGDLGEPSE